MDQLWVLGKGLPQGAKSSPKLFDIHIDGFLEAKKNTQIDLKEAYADDILTIGWGIN